MRGRGSRGEFVCKGIWGGRNVGVALRRCYVLFGARVCCGSRVILVYL